MCQMVLQATQYITNTVSFKLSFCKDVFQPSSYFQLCFTNKLKCWTNSSEAFPIFSHTSEGVIKQFKPSCILITALDIVILSLIIIQTSGVSTCIIYLFSVLLEFSLQKAEFCFSTVYCITSSGHRIRVRVAWSYIELSLTFFRFIRISRHSYGQTTLHCQTIQYSALTAPLIFCLRSVSHLTSVQTWKTSWGTCYR